MRIQILTDPAETCDYLAAVSAASDANRTALGFLPASVFRDQASAGRLWLAVHQKDRAYAGHLLFGGRYPHLRIVQIFVPELARRQGIATRLIQRLIQYGEENDYLAVRARVAADLAANAFWENLGFHHVKTVHGGRTTGRRINLRLRQLDVPTLFDLRRTPEHPVLRPTLEFEELPVLEAPSYGFDLNVIFDVVRDRKRRSAASTLIRASFNHFVRLMVTHEAQQELLRTPPGPGESDPLIEFIKELPVLPPVAEEVLDPLVERLRPLVFPEPDRSLKRAAQDSSDLRHLAACVHHGLTGFVTGERALLRASRRLWETFKLEVLSPLDFLDQDEVTFPKALPITASVADQDLHIQPLKDADRAEVISYLAELGIDGEVVREVWSPGARGRERMRLSARVQDRLIGVGAWDCPAPLRAERNCWLYVSEEEPGAIRFVDHLLESVLTSRPDDEPGRVFLHHGASQTITRRTALQRGFRSMTRTDGGETTLVKVAHSSVVLSDRWTNFRDAFLRLTEFEVPRRMPGFDEVKETGLTVRHKRTDEHVAIGFFDFETMISPGAILYPGRRGVIIPIRQPYADELLAGIRHQLSLLPSSEALLRIERAYFRSARKVETISKGCLAVFYVSGWRGGEKAAVACARITSTAVHEVGEAMKRYRRQGVLSGRELEEIGGKRGVVHAVTFDNLIVFPNPVTYKRLKDLGCVGGANLVTIEALGYEELSSLLREGLWGSSGGVRR